MPTTSTVPKPTRPSGTTFRSWARAGTATAWSPTTSTRPFRTTVPFRAASAAWMLRATSPRWSSARRSNACPTAGSSSHGKSVQHNAFAHGHTEKRPASSPRTGFPPIRFRAAVSPKPRPNEAYPRSTARPSIRALGSHTRYRPRSSRCRRPGGRRSCAAHARR